MNISFLFSGSAMHGGKKKTFRSQAHIRKVTTEKKRETDWLLVVQTNEKCQQNEQKKRKKQNRSRKTTEFDTNCTFLFESDDIIL